MNDYIRGFVALALLFSLFLYGNPAGSKVVGFPYANAAEDSQETFDRDVKDLVDLLNTEKNPEELFEKLIGSLKDAYDSPELLENLIQSLTNAQDQPKIFRDLIDSLIAAQNSSELFKNLIDSLKVAQGSSALFNNLIDSLNAAQNSSELFKNLIDSLKVAQGSSALFNNLFNSLVTTQGQPKIFKDLTDLLNAAQSSSELFKKLTNSLVAAQSSSELFRKLTNSLVAAQVSGGLCDPSKPPPGGSGSGSGSGGGGSCKVLGPDNLCAPEKLEKACSAWNGNEASKVCNVESAGGNPLSASGSDRVRSNGDCAGKYGANRLAYSHGLFQINLTVHKIGGLNCPSAFSGKNNNATITNCSLYEACVAKAQDPDLNIAKACELYKGRGNNWDDWRNTANKCGL